MKRSQPVPPRDPGERGYNAARGEFRLMAPSAESIELIFRDHPAGPHQWVAAMRRDADVAGLWFAVVPQPGRYYRYRVHFPWGTSEMADPHSHAVARQKSIGHAAWSVALRQPAAPQLRGRPASIAIVPISPVILEVHLADMTVHPSAGAVAPATYAGFAEVHAAAVGGAQHATALGVDAVELMPLAPWPYYEGHGDSDEAAPRVNHWGYMPSFMLAVADRFASHWASTPYGGWVGVDADGHFADPAVELVALIDALHERGLAVVVDVVWNHVSLHDRNPILALDPGSWIRRGADGFATSDSGCGNDLNANDPEMRRLILAAVHRWVGDFGVDGLRLDLGELLGDDALADIARTARALRPDIWLSAEPWSLVGYRPREVAACGYAVWNDRSRILLRGKGPGRDGVLFGVGAHDAGTVDAVVDALEGGRGFLDHAADGVTYVESHDGLTLGDRIRASGGDEDEVAAAVMLATALLAATRGAVLLHAGQTFGRHRRCAPPASDGQVVRGNRRSDTATGDDAASAVVASAGGVSAVGVSFVDNAYDRDDAASHIDWGDRSAVPQLSAWSAAWLAARRRWLRPCFAANARRHRIDARDGPAFALLATSQDVTVATAFNLSSVRTTTLVLPAGAELVIGGEVGVCFGENDRGLRMPPRSAAVLLLR